MNKAFTLIELLTVILVIGILTAIALPRYARAVRRAEMVEGLTNGKTMFESAVRYKSINSVSPTLFTQLDAAMPTGTGDQSVFEDANFTYTLFPNYLKVSSTKGGYDVLFMYPEVTSSGVLAPILCCPHTNSADGEWLCKQTAKTADNTYLSSHELVDSCREIK